MNIGEIMFLICFGIIIPVLFITAILFAIYSEKLYPKTFKLEDLNIEFIEHYAEIRMVSGSNELISYENYKQQCNNNKEYIIDRGVSYSKYNIETVELLGLGQGTLDKHTYDFSTDMDGNIVDIANRNAKFVLLGSVKYKVKDGIAIRE